METICEAAHLYEKPCYESNYFKDTGHNNNVILY